MERVAWREDGMRLASASDDRTVRVWDVKPRCESCSGGSGGNSGKGNGKDMEVLGEEEDKAAAWEEEERDGGGRLAWTGWRHASRVWDVGFASLGVVSCGEVKESSRNRFVLIYSTLLDAHACAMLV